MTLRRLIPATVIATTAIAVALACLALSTQQLRAARATLVAELEGLGEILGTQAVVALAEGDASSAEVMLLSLGARGDIDAAAVFDARGAPFAQYLRDYEAGVAIPDDPGAAGARFSPGFVEYVRDIERADQRIGAFYLRASTQRLNDLLWDSLAIGALVFLVSVVPGLLAAFRLVRSIARPLSALAEVAQRTAAGDLSMEIDAAAASGEIGALTQAFREMTARLRGAVSDIVTGSGAITQAAEGLREASQRIGAHAERQEISAESMSSALQGVNQGVKETNQQLDALAAVAEQVSSSGLEMQAVTRSVGEAAGQLVVAIEHNAAAAREAAGATAHVSEIATALDGSAEQAGAAVERVRAAIDALRERAQRSNERAAAAAAASRDGADSARLTAGAVEGVRGAHDALGKVVAELAEKSSAIEEVVGIVEGVVDETRLLALNAGILAAQAGQHGRAFSVVADQIGELAGRTASSTGTIGNHLAALRRGIAAAVEGNAEIGARIRDGAKQAEHTDGAFARLLETAGEFAAESRDIRELAEGQTVALEQVSPAFARVRELAAQIQAAVRSHGGAADEIAKSMDEARMLGAEVRSSIEQHGEAAHSVAEAVVELREGVEAAKAVAEVQLAAAGSIRTELLTVASGTQDGVGLAGDMRELVDSLAARAQELARSAAQFRLREGNGARDRRRGVAPPTK